MNPTIGIIRDGHSDFLVVKKFISILFEKHRNINLIDDDFIEFKTLNITNALTDYVKKSQIEEYDLHGKHAISFRQRLIKIIEQAYWQLCKRKEGGLTNKDILVINGDSERILGHYNQYFGDWASAINAIIWLAIEEFYEKMVQQGYEYQYLPLIAPIILFPCSEILVAAAMPAFKKENYRNFKAKPTLKQKVYGTDKIPTALKTGKLQKVLDKYVITENLSDIYKNLPEVRRFMQVLAN